MDRVPLNDLRASHLTIRQELRAAIDGVIESSQFIGGGELSAFAGEWARYCRVAHAIPCSSGTDALLLAILGACGPGDGRREIITVSQTFVATVEVIRRLNYRPVLVDVEPDTLLMDLNEVADAVSRRTAAIVPVHLYGQMVAVDELEQLAERYSIPVIEDASQAHGASWRGIRPGERSTAATFSFHPSKNLGALGDAGAVVTESADLAGCAMQLRDHGRAAKHTHELIGYNARMDNLQAAVLRRKLAHLDAWNQARRAAADRYDAALAGLDGCRTPAVHDDAHHVFHQYVVQVNDREAVTRAFERENIGFGVHYAVPVHEQPAYRFLGLRPHDLPNTHRASLSVLSLPMHPQLTAEQINHVCDTIRRALATDAPPAVPTHDSPGQDAGRSWSTATTERCDTACTDAAAV